MDTVVQYDFWETVLFQYLGSLPIPMSLCLTALTFIQLLILSGVDFNRSKIRSLLETISRNLESENEEFSNLSSSISRRTHAEYTHQYEQARKLLSKLESFFKTNRITSTYF